MLYTRKGDNGTTKTFGCDQRMSKTSVVAEALGALDEINSFLGLVKIKSKQENLFIDSVKLSFEQIIHSVQETLFSIQAETAGYNKSIPDTKVKDLELIIDSAEKEMPPIKTFFISGGTEIASLCDISRTIARRAERRLVAVKEESIAKVGDQSLAYMNRLSSLLYALARYSNYKLGHVEKAPSYN